MLNPINFISKFIKSSNQRELDKINKIVKTINSNEEKIKELEDKDFPKKTIEFKEKIKKGISLDELLPEAFALVREAAKRTIANVILMCNYKEVLSYTIQKQLR